MIATIRDAETLYAVRPAEAAAYLRSHAWKQTEVLGERATVWTKSAGEAGEYEILLPMDTTLRDYARRIAEALQTLEVAEARSQIAIVRDIATATADVIRIRLQHGFMENGTIPLDFAARMIEQAQELMLSAAYAAQYPRAAAYAGRKPARILAYLRGLRMGPTEAGSFIISIHSPVPPRLQYVPDANGEDWEETPFERSVTLTLADALARARGAVNAAATSGAFEPFDTAVESGVSANLCGALVALGMNDTAEFIEISIHWSSSRPAAPELPARFHFGRDTFPLLREAERLLRHLDDARPLSIATDDMRRLPA